MKQKFLFAVTFLLVFYHVFENSAAGKEKKKDNFTRLFSFLDSVSKYNNIILIYLVAFLSHDRFKHLGPLTDHPTFY